MRVAMRASTRLVNPGSAFGSNTTVGNPRSTAASIIGPAAYPPTPKRRGKPVPAKNRKRIPHRRDKFRRVAREFHPADALESRRANRLERKPGLGHQARFNPALRSDKHDFPFSFLATSIPGRRPEPEIRGRPCRRLQSAVSNFVAPNHHDRKPSVAPASRRRFFASSHHRKTAGETPAPQT